MSLFRGLVFHFPPSEGEQDQDLSLSRDLLKLRVRQHGGGVSEELDSGQVVTHVITDQVPQHIRQLRSQRVKNGEKLFYLLSTSWLEESISNQRLLGVGQYLM